MSNLSAIIRMCEKKGVAINKHMPVDARIGLAAEQIMALSQESGNRISGEECIIASHMLAGYGRASFIMEKHGFNRVDIFPNGKVFAYGPFPKYKRIPIKMKKEKCFGSIKEAIKNDAEMHYNGRLMLEVYAKAVKLAQNKFATLYSKTAPPAPLSCYANASTEDLEKISCLWMALESGMGIAFTGEESAVGKAIFSFLSLLPSNGKIAMFSKNRVWLDAYPNIILSDCLAKEKGGKVMSGIVGLRVMLAASDAPEECCIRRAFEASNYGIPFAINLGDIAVEDSVRVLLSSPYNISRELISALDLIVQIDNNGMISGMLELKWAEKSITSPPIYGYKITNMAEKGPINKMLLKSSEIAKFYTRINPSNISSFEKEIALRSRYLCIEGRKAVRAGHSSAYFATRFFGFIHKRIKYSKS